MKFLNLTESAVKKANRAVYNKISIEAYNRNPSIFESTRQEKIKEILREISQSIPGEKYFLDVGCGTGNVLRLATAYFQIALGVDLADELLQKVKQRQPELKLVAAEADHLPFKKGSFDCIACYGTLHHIVNLAPVLKASYETLKKGGCLYTDHDPNWFLGRFYHLYYRIRYKERPGFGIDTAEIAEYHHTQTGGLNPEIIRQQLLRLGFKQADIYYRYTSNPRLPLLWKVMVSILIIITYFIPHKNLYTHFYIIARK